MEGRPKRGPSFWLCSETLIGCSPRLNLVGLQYRFQSNPGSSSLCSSRLNKPISSTSASSRWKSKSPCRRIIAFGWSSAISRMRVTSLASALRPVVATDVGDRKQAPEIVGGPADGPSRQLRPKVERPRRRPTAKVSVERKGRCGRALFSACSATPRDPLRRMTRRYPTADAAGERRSSDQALRPPMPGRAWRSRPALSSSRRASKRR
jgi:hypothetical protein